MIRAGLVSEVQRDSGEWIFADVGFSRNASSCGLLVGNGEPSEMTFGKFVASIAQAAARGDSPLNLLIEAPLSVAFTGDGNPTGRSVERRGRESRYWYAGLGCSVLVATMHLLQAVLAEHPRGEIRLFEGFAS